MIARRRRPSTLPIGVFSDGTLRTEDLIPAYVRLLQAVRLSRRDRQTVSQIDREFCALPSGGRWNGHDEPVIDWTDDQHAAAAIMLETLQDVADQYAPAYTYVGTADGDGACFGVWPAFDRIDEDGYGSSPDVARNRIDVDARDVARENGAAYAMNVNDHGNATLYRRAGRRWIEVWSVV